LLIQQMLRLNQHLSVFVDRTILSHTVRTGLPIGPYDFEPYN
jgi:hypothetical protein